MFILNACGNGNLNHPANIDNKEAINFKTGRTFGKAEVSVAPEIQDNGEAVYKEPKKILENANLEVDWDKKEVSFSALISVSETAGVEVKENVIFTGHFNDEGIAYLVPQNNKLKALVGVRCKDACDELVADITLRRTVDGRIEKEVRQLTLQNPKNEKTPTDSSDDIVREIYPEGSSLTDSSGLIPTIPALPVLPPQPKKIPVKAPPILEKEEDEDAREEFDEPGIPSLLPGVVTDEMLDSDKPEDTKLSNYSGNSLFPIDLGVKYSGKSDGFYSRYCKDENRDKRTKRCRKYSYGELLKGTDVAISGNKDTEPRIGFASIDRSDKVYYGSGFLVKMIEEAGKLFVKAMPGNLFEVNDLSKKAGGKVSPHASHQNGLDVDIRLPKLSNGRFDYKKAWVTLSSFVSLGYVDVVFLNPVRIKEFCSYLQKSGEKNYQSAFHKLYQETGHKTHMHVRLQCTNHNVGCMTAAYETRKYGVCK
jgi:penicillin-insensitive murein endopeptidase